MSSINYCMTCIGIVLAASFLQVKINGKRINRVKQFLFPAFALVVGVIELVALLKLRTFIYNLLESFDLYIGFRMEVALFNAAIMLGFVVVKLVVGPIIRRFWSDDSLIETVSGTVYELDEEQHIWFLRPQWVKHHKFWLHIVYAALCATAMIMCVTWANGTESALWIMAFPSIAAIILIEVYSYYGGITKEEFEHNVHGEDSHSQRMSKFYKLRAVLEALLPERLLGAHTGYEYLKRETPVDMIKKWEKSEEINDRVTVEFFKKDDREKRANVDGVVACHQMMHGKNVVFLNPFYKDMELYITLPMVCNMLKGKKCLIVTGRQSNVEDMKVWMKRILGEFSHMESLWSVSQLSNTMGDFEVGILSFPQLYDHEVIEGNKEFFRQVGFVFLVEPSRILSTGQVALSIVAQEMEQNNPDLVYCVCDRETEGLVDSLSHLLHAEFTEVIAAPIPRCIYTGMGWDADGDFFRQHLFDKHTRYLGNGVELAAIAVKNQISKVTWYCESKAPMRDIQWITGQQYSTICKYMKLPIQQKSINERIEFNPNIWDSEIEKEKFIIAEDEFCNMFSIMRAYLSRGTNQSFVNVFSENYLLRDYMRYNKEMFLNNANSIPSMVPDYAKTARNTLIKLLIEMSYREVSEEEIRKEYNLIGIEVTDVYQTLMDMLKKYTYVPVEIFTIRSARKNIDVLSVEMEDYYYIEKDKFNRYFANSLKNAYFVLEEEKYQNTYIDAKLYNYVSQCVLPGQFVTYDGKYYLVKYVSPSSGVVLRRAADLYDCRRYYRQIREYQIKHEEPVEVISQRKIMDIEMSFIQMSYDVKTSGYFDMKDMHDLSTAKKVDFSGDPSVQNYTRQYRNKSVLRIGFEQANPEMIYTLGVLMSEMFRTLFPDGWQYLAVIAKKPEGAEGILDHIVYAADEKMGENYLYILEDSEIDLGLLEAIERNFARIMEITTDFILWHQEKMDEKPEEPKQEQSASEEQKGEQKKKKGFLRRLFEKLFGKKKGKEEAAESTGETQEETSATEGETPGEESTEPEKTVQTEYQEKCYLKFGTDEISSVFKLEELLAFLLARGWDDNALTKARTRTARNNTLLDTNAENQCDFCGMYLSGVSYEVLDDGRVRCNDCSRTAITTVSEFSELFKQILEMMNAIYGIEYRTPIDVATANAKVVAKGAGAVFRPGKQFVARVLGFAQKLPHHKFRILMENGSPRLATIDTMTHEMTHIWQYLNWSDADFKRAYGMRGRKKSALARLLVYEGMAMWAAIQYLYMIGEQYYAMEQETLAERRNDEYGVGFRLFREHYPLIKDSSLLVNTPFKTFPPVPPEDIFAIVEQAFKQ